MGIFDKYPNKCDDNQAFGQQPQASFNDLMREARGMEPSDPQLLFAAQHAERTAESAAVYQDGTEYDVEGSFADPYDVTRVIGHIALPRF